MSDVDMCKRCILKFGGYAAFLYVVLGGISNFINLLFLPF